MLRVQITSYIQNERLCMKEKRWAVTGYATTSYWLISLSGIVWRPYALLSVRNVAWASHSTSALTGTVGVLDDLVTPSLVCVTSDLEDIFERCLQPITSNSMTNTPNTRQPTATPAVSPGGFELSPLPIRTRTRTRTQVTQENFPFFANYILHVCVLLYYYKGDVMWALAYILLIVWVVILYIEREILYNVFKRCH